MADRRDPIYERAICVRCGGDGIYTEVEGGGSVVCLTCFGYGTKRVAPTEVLKNGVIYTFELIDATDDSEYSVLSTSQKNVFALIVSSGIIDISSGTAIRTKLWDMFGDGSTTRTNLEALMAQ
jgi:hypothetical protein